jgi:indole-3-glycerol phosphate synthase
MSTSTGTFLDRILDKRRERVDAARRARPLDEVRAAAAQTGPVRKPSFAGQGPFVIAEVKKASPSKGLLREHFAPVEIAQGYDAAGAAAISVLTEEDFFQGSLEHMRAVRQAVSKPVLRKDFVFDPYQLYEGRAAGADLFLLIMAMLGDEEYAELKAVGESLGMTALVEVHDAAEAERALRLQPELLGINNRNLKTFHTSLDVTLDMLPSLPKGVRVVSESGLSGPAELQKLMGQGVDTFLIGETFMRAPDPGECLRRLIADARYQS